MDTKINVGYCPICEKKVNFHECGEWLRDYYICGYCQSIPRQRAIINALNVFVPNWQGLDIHESSPGGKSSDYIKSKCHNYSESQYYPNAQNGEMVNSVRCENLECLTFDNNSFDIFVTQDVFEHIFHPEKALREIERVLKPNGMHIFTVPWRVEYNTCQRARLEGSKVEYLKPPVYHGNPIDDSGSLVVFDWGIDFIDFLHKNSGMYTTVYLERNRSMGLDGEMLHVFISKKFVQ
ncbi:MAG: methyltransferase [Clostridiaceae bacterium]|jgi:SAM-dependent methyltransferase|nr:methyltransferase [Clostridiaceae bacterium]